GADPAHARLEHAFAQHALERAYVGENRVHQLAAALGIVLGADFFVRSRAHRVHSPRYLGSISRQVSQSWCTFLPHGSTRFGTPCLPSASAIRHDSPMSSARPSPDARSKNRS